MFSPAWQRKILRKQERNYKAPPVLEGFRIILKPPAMDDFKQWRQVRLENSDFLKPFQPEWAEDCLTKTGFEKRIAGKIREYNNGRGAFFVIHHKVSKKIIGAINLNDIRMGAAHHASLGYWVAKSWEGQGFMSEAGNLVIDHAFNILKLRRINAACLPNNHRSANLLLRLGFEEEGYAKAYLQINGRWQDHRLFGLTNNKH